MVDLEFARRLERACNDLAAIVPEPGHGRLGVLADAVGVSQEAVRRWFAGDARPRPAKMAKLSKFLQCDEAWLSLGVKTDMRPQDKNLFARATEGASHYVLGKAMIEGNACSTPDEHDPRRPFVDFYLIRSGSQMPVRASIAKATTPGAGLFEFVVPRQYKGVAQVGIVSMNYDAEIELLLLAEPLIAKHATQKGDEFIVPVKMKAGAFKSGNDQWKTFKTFKEI